MAKTRIYYAHQLLGTQKQQLAADRLLSLLTLKEVLAGRLTTFLAAKWGREPSAIRGMLGRARGLVYQYASYGSKLANLYEEFAGDATMLQMSAIRENFAKYGAVMCALEAALVKDLDHPQAEEMIRRMFDDEVVAIFASRRSGDRKRKGWEASVKKGPGRPIGRPPGSKNKPKDVMPEGETWPVPEGFKTPIKITPAAPESEWD